MTRMKPTMIDLSKIAFTWNSVQSYLVPVLGLFEHVWKTVQFVLWTELLQSCPEFKILSIYACNLLESDYRYKRKDQFDYFHLSIIQNNLI